MQSDKADKILSVKGANVHSVTPDQPAIDAMALMGQRRIAAGRVVSAGRPVGIMAAEDFPQIAASVYPNRAEGRTPIFDLRRGDYGDNEDNPTAPTEPTCGFRKPPVFSPVVVAPA